MTDFGKEQESARSGAMPNPYADIIDLPHPISKKHPPMPVSNRAAQFAPFAALTGFHEEIERTAREWNKGNDEQ